jgi:hypothetical protein
MVFMFNNFGDVKKVGVLAEPDAVGRYMKCSPPWAPVGTTPFLQVWEALFNK